MLPRIALTSGDPAGIGPEIAIRAAADAGVLAMCHPVIYGPSSPAELSRYEPGRVSADAGR